MKNLNSKFNYLDRRVDLKACLLMRFLLFFALIFVEFQLLCEALVRIHDWSEKFNIAVRIHHRHSMSEHKIGNYYSGGT